MSHCHVDHYDRIYFDDHDHADHCDHVYHDYHDHAGHYDHVDHDNDDGFQVEDVRLIMMMIDLHTDHGHDDLHDDDDGFQVDYVRGPALQIAHYRLISSPLGRIAPRL